MATEKENQIISQKIIPFLWFDDNAEEAAHFYTSVFKNSKITGIARNTEGSPSGKPGTVLTVSFNLDGQQFTALNGGPVFQFTEAVSFVVNCETQEEVDYYWEKLSEGGKEIECGWLKDKYGLAWQIVPSVLPKLLQDKDAEKAKRAMLAMLKMKKLDIKKLEEA